MATRLIFMYCLVGMLFLAPELAQSQVSELNLDEIRHAWKNRVSSYKTARFSWIKEQVMLSLEDKALDKPVTTGSSGVITLSGNSYYEERSQEVYNSKLETVTESGRRIMVYHKNCGKTYYPDEERGSVRSRNPLLTFFDGPMLIEWFAAEPSFLYEKEYVILRVEGDLGHRVATIGNTDYNDPKYVLDSRQELELKEDLGWLVTTVRSMYPDGQVRAQLDVKYTANEGAGAVPEEIALTSFSINQRDTVDLYSKIVISDVEINIPIDQNLFDFEFPSGTLVYDVDMEIKYIAGVGPQVDFDSYVDAAVMQILGGPDTKETVESDSREKSRQSVIVRLFNAKAVTTTLDWRNLVLLFVLFVGTVTTTIVVLKYRRQYEQILNRRRAGFGAIEF